MSRALAMVPLVGDRRGRRQGADSSVARPYSSSGGGRWGRWGSGEVLTCRGRSAYDQPLQASGGAPSLLAVGLRVPGDRQAQAVPLKAKRAKKPIWKSPLRRSEKRENFTSAECGAAPYFPEPPAQRLGRGLEGRERRSCDTSAVVIRKPRCSKGCEEKRREHALLFSR